MTKLRHYGTLAALVLAALLLIPARAQDADDGRGVVRIATGNASTDILVTLVLPRLFDVDPATGALLDARSSSRALAAAILSDLPSDEVTLSLDATRLWSDGAPVTAYDVLFSLLSYTEPPQYPYFAGLQEIAGVGITDDHTIVLRFAATDAERAELTPNAQPPMPTCDDLPRINVPIVRSSTWASDFRKFVEHRAPEGESPSLDAWWQAYRDAELPSPSSALETVTSGVYAVPDFETEDGQLVPVDGAGAALMLVQVNKGVDSLIAGDTNVLLDVPIDQRAGLRSLANPNARNFQIAEVPGRESLVVLLNLANPARPLPGFHPETGEPLDQGRHPILSDVRVRRALQLAIDQNAIIDGVLQRSAEPLSGLFPPGSWAYDSTLPAAETNIEAAKSLLDEAGWIDRGSGRYCVGCQTAPEGAPLQLTLSSAYDDYEIASEIARQWGQVGAVVILSGENTYALAGQTFDAYLLSVGGEAYEAADPDRSLMLTPAGDILNPNAAPENQLLNYGSYDNPAVTDLLEQARMLPGCDPAARADLYHQVERLLQQDLPFLPVAAPNEFYAAAPNVLGFAPRTGDPLWNVESWVVSP